MSDQRSEEEVAINNFEQILQEHKGTRNQLYQKLTNVLENLDLNPNNDKSTITEAKLKVLSTLDDLMNSESNEHDRLIKQKLKKREAESTNVVGEIVTEFLRQSGTQLPVPDQQTNVNSEKTDKEIDQAFEQNCNPINNAETELVSESRDDVLEDDTETPPEE